MENILDLVIKTVYFELCMCRIRSTPPKIVFFYVISREIMLVMKVLL